MDQKRQHKKVVKYMPLLLACVALASAVVLLKLRHSDKGSSPGVCPAQYGAVQTSMPVVLQSCRKVLWFMAVLNHNEGSNTAVDKLCSAGSAATALKQLAIAVRMIRTRAPSVIPVVIYQGQESVFTRWLHAQGATVLFHQLSIDQKLPWDYINKNNMQEWRGTLLRLDIPLVLPQLWKLLKEQGNLQMVDQEYALYADIDVWPQRDVSSCSLPKPLTISMGPEANPVGTKENAGVLYINLTSFAQLRSDLIEYADIHELWSTLNDQTLLGKYFEQSSTTLPATWNWKPYWGKPSKVLWSMPEQLHAMHFHGPKVPTVLCLFEKWEALGDSCPELTQAAGALEAAVEQLEATGQLCGRPMQAFIEACGARHIWDLQLFMLAVKSNAKAVYQAAHEEAEEVLASIQMELCRE